MPPSEGQPVPVIVGISLPPGEKSNYRCDACGIPIRMEVPTVFHLHRACNVCFYKLVPEAKGAPWIDET